jgi:hypothetical protein
MEQIQPQESAQVQPPSIFGDLEKPQAAEEKTTDEAKAEDQPASTEEIPAKPPEGEKPKEDETPNEGEKEKPVVPEKYDLKLSEKSPLNQAHLDRIAASAKAQGLTQEQAQELVKTQETEVNTALKDAVEQRKAQWLDECKSDKEIGGAAFEKSVKLAIGVLDKYGDESFRKELTDGGFGNHPGLVRMLARIGKVSANDKAIIPRTTEKVVERSTADVLYDKTK